MKMNKSAEGMILDMRGNGGGYNADRELLFGDMFREPRLIGYQKKQGRIRKTGSFLGVPSIHLSGSCILQ